jgi:hypothetical protein
MTKLSLNQKLICRDWVDYTSTGWELTESNRRRRFETLLRFVQLLPTELTLFSDEEHALLMGVYMI